MRLDYRSPEALAPVIEALLFASDEPLAASALRSLILGEEVAKQEIVDEPESAPTDTSSSSESEPSDAAASNGESTGGSDSVESSVQADPIEVAAGPAEEAAAGAPAEKKRKKRQLIELVTLHVAVQHLNSLYEQQDRVFRIVEIAGGYQFATRPEYSEYVARLTKEKSRRRLSGAALESLAIIAYKQPVSKLDIENIRGVNCDEVLKSLMEKNLITITGRAEAVGRPLLYGTTTDFLRHFGLHSLSDLPRPREIDELMKEEAFRATTLEEAAHDFVSDNGAEDNSMTVDEAVAVARELAELESNEMSGGSNDQDSNGIELDVDAMSYAGEGVNPGHAEIAAEDHTISE